MLPGNTEHKLVRKKLTGIQFVGFIKVEIDKCQIQSIFEYQICRTDRPVFKKLDWSIRIFFVKGGQHIREKDSAQKRRNTDADRCNLLSEIVKL